MNCLKQMTFKKPKLLRSRVLDKNANVCHKTELIEIYRVAFTFKKTCPSFIANFNLNNTRLCEN